ncbi:MAG TPA: ParB/RepB/Spo0J family partition protein [Saprospiraceae bacterium]|jgi:ParB family chromosome partitioning protein|nr:ParB/RepB/Spo0J family partition protein [Saprospiraceae bacterium]HMR87891.1 ParB/RepB/Spo0J family partition protein [Saprospiraceae bacterium]HMU03876.1 ParB/RepB/Spo0J family partition protein [Saprospiraceae bacterium]
MNKRNEVSKGLRSLLSNIEKTNNPTERSQLVRELTNSIAFISPEMIEVNPYQPRTEFDADQLMDLAKSIKISGLIQPITVRAMGGNKYQLISGERRLRASKMAGIKEVPAYVRVANDQEMLEMALVENIQRADLNALEIAISYQRLMDECNLTHEALSDRVGKDRSTVTNYVRLLKLPAQIQSSIKDGAISMGHARALAGIDNIALQLKVYKDVIDQGLSVRALEQVIKSFNTSKPSNNTSQKPVEAYSAEIKKIKDEISHALGSKVDIKRDHAGKGSITISFSSDDQLNSIVDFLRKDN